MTQPTSGSVSSTNLANAFKEMFPDRRLEQQATLERDLLKWLPKADDFEGINSVAASGGWMYIPVRYAMNQARSAHFAQTQAAVTAGVGHGKVARFALDRKSYYGSITFDRESVMAARSNKGAFYRIKEKEIEDLLTGMGMEAEKHLWGDGNGNLGQIGSITTANPGVITLANAEDIVNFEVGMLLGADTGISGEGTNRDGTEEVTKVDYDAGTVTMTSDVVTDHSWAANDYLFRSTGDDVNAAGDGGQVMQGVAGWIPATAETSGTFLGQDRTLDTVRLQGSRQSWLGSIEETLKKLLSKMHRIGARPDSIFVSYANWHRLELELGARAIREEAKDSPFGLSSLRYAGPKGVMRVMPAVYCPDDVGYCLRRDTWKLHHLGGFPHVIVTNGNREQQLTGADGSELRVCFFGNLACHSPKDNGVFSIT